MEYIIQKDFYNLRQEGLSQFFLFFDFYNKICYNIYIKLRKGESMDSIYSTLFGIMLGENNRSEVIGRDTINDYTITRCISGGENIYPREIEEFLSAMPEIRDIQVAAVKSKRYGEITGAFIILHEGKTLTEQDVIEFCRDKLAKFKWPQLVMFVDSFPLTGSGKIQKFKLTELGTKYRKEVLGLE